MGEEWLILRLESHLTHTAARNIMSKSVANYTTYENVCLT